MIKFNLKKACLPRAPERRRGFTLLEALVAISILMVAVVAPITISQKGLSSAIYSKSQMIASYLAQDAIEYIKNKRDEYSINHLDAYNNPDWGNFGIFELCKAPGGIGTGCQIDTIKQVDIENNNGGEAVSAYSSASHLFIDNNGFYGYTSAGSKETIFTRQIKITMNPFSETNSNSDEANVNVVVHWGSNPSDKIDINTLIYNY